MRLSTCIPHIPVLWVRNEYKIKPVNMEVRTGFAYYENEDKRGGICNSWSIDKTLYKMTMMIAD